MCAPHEAGAIFLLDGDECAGGENHSQVRGIVLGDGEERGGGSHKVRSSRSPWQLVC